MKRADELKRAYRLEPHPEGGSFSESYTSPFETDGRSLAGSIYFLLDAGEISHFHEIDCDEMVMIRFFHGTMPMLSNESILRQCLFRYRGSSIIPACSQ